MRNNLIPSIALIFLFTITIFAQSDALLRATVEKDRLSRDANGKLFTLPASEHVLRGLAYFDNRHFSEAREHFQKILDIYPNDPAVPRALFVMGRSHMWERKCQTSIPFFDRVSREFPETKDGREGLAFKGACYVRLGMNNEAAETYEQYTVMYPSGERIDSAYLNIIDALREAKRYDEAAAWVVKTRVKFAGMPTEANSLHALLRMEIHRQNWNAAAAAADLMLSGLNFRGSMTNIDEVKYLKAFALEKIGRRSEAMNVYASIPISPSSYFSGMAADKVAASGSRVRLTANVTPRVYDDYPLRFNSEILRYARPKGVDPRFVLAIMKQESSFRPTAKSPAAARGLLQLVFDTAVKYNKRAGIPSLSPDDLYDPATNIAIGVEYIADLRKQFDGLYEAIAASYNAGEDNAARWLNRTNPKDPAIFASEVGFAETKNYVAKVMANYRVYRDLYDEDLRKR